MLKKRKRKENNEDSVATYQTTYQIANGISDQGGKGV
jgi:hypothetical protein